MKLWDKAVEVRFQGIGLGVNGSFRYARDEGPRIAFNGERSIRADPDQGTVRIWNLPDDISRAMANDARDLQLSLRTIQRDIALTDQVRAERIKREIERYTIEVYAGYGDSPQLIFRGSPVEVRPRVRDGLDYITEIDVGDAFVVLNEQYLASQFGVGETPANLLAFAFALADARGSVDEMRAKVGLVAPNAASARLANGFVAVGRPVDMIRDIVDLYSVQWWVRNGKVEMVARDEVLQDFAVLLDENANLLSLGEKDENESFEFTSVLSPSIHPGRGAVFRTLEGEQTNARILATQIQFDTHSDAWTVSGVASSADFSLAALYEP